MKYSAESLRPKLDAFLQPVLAHAGFELSYELTTPSNPHPEVENPEVTVVFSGNDVELLLLNRAELLLALQHISMEAMRVPPEDHSLISFDANDYRMMRVEELRMSAMAAAEKVRRSHVPFHFNPMSSRERRIIHLALRDEKELRSESLGVGPTRAVVVVPADMPTPPAPPPPPRGFNRGAGSSGGSGRPPGGGGGGFRGNREGGPPRGDRPPGDRNSADRPRGPRRGPR
jgi:spoIIIJ-associated protein